MAIPEPGRPSRDLARWTGDPWPLPALSYTQSVRDTGGDCVSEAYLNLLRATASLGRLVG